MSVLGRLVVTRGQHVPQRAKALAQALDAVRDQVCRPRLNMLRQGDGVSVDVLEAVADRRPGVFGMVGVVPFQGAQQFLPDRMVMGMTERPQTGRVQGLSFPVQPA